MTAKNLLLRPITSTDANAFIKRVHYSGKVAQNSQLHIGVYWNGNLEGALQFGPSLDKRKIQTLVRDTPWNGFLELNRMAFTERLPTNSESRAIAISIRLLRKHAPHVQWIVSFADGTQCGDGTIYRAAGFILTGINESRNLVRLPNGTVIHKMTLESNPTRPRPELGGRSYYAITNGRYDLNAYATATGGTITTGYQFRYIYPIHPTARERLTIPEIPYHAIPPHARMYRGKRASEAGDDQHPVGTAVVQH